ncbi:MAG: type II CRISPR-associated endonuclease Cas1, partial [Brevinematales bacterium]
VAMLLPIGTHSTVSRNYALQAMAKTVLKKNLWAEIVRKKVKFQSDLLDKLGRPNPLRRMMDLVRSGDTTNVEGHAARLYWEALFGDHFVRNREREDANRFLNYGYIVLRSCVARALCSSGLHPSFGIYHHNQYNAYCLVDDMMEPFRPLVDEIVFHLIQRIDPEEEFSSDIKKELVSVLKRRVVIDGRSYELFDALSLVSSSLLLSYERGEMLLRLPEKIFEE